MYVKMKKKECEKLGIEYVGYDVPEDISENKLIDYVKELEDDEKVSGILVQLPLPQHINETRILDIISP